MDAFALTIAMFFAIAPAIGDAAKQPVRAEEVIAEWALATRAVTSVRGSVSVISYDDTFGTISHANGKFGYFQPHDGFWKISNTPATLMKEQNSGKRRSHRHIEYPAEHRQWHEGCFRDVDDESKKYAEYSPPESTSDDSSTAEKGIWGFLFGRFDAGTVDRESPFLPGLPNKSVIEKWIFEVTDESATHIWLHATPKDDFDKKQCASCDLYVQKNPLGLEAVQYIAPGSRQRKVFLFTEVKLNPSSQEKPDVSGYKCVTMSPGKPKAEE